MTSPGHRKTDATAFYGSGTLNFYNNVNTTTLSYESLCASDYFSLLDEYNVPGLPPIGGCSFSAANEYLDGFYGTQTSVALVQYATYQSWLVTNIASGNLPKNQPGSTNVIMVYFPYFSHPVDPTGADVCSYGAYHYHFNDPTVGDVYFAIIPTCQYQNVFFTSEASHELAETMTDPHADSAPFGWQVPNQPGVCAGWEIGDPCEQSQSSVGGRPVQELWSRAAGACVSIIDVPQNVATFPGDGQVTLTWSPAKGATSYTVAVFTDSNLTQILETVPGSQPGVAITGLRNGVTYYFIVTATNATDSSYPSLPAVAGTPSADSAIVGAGDFITTATGYFFTDTCAVCPNNADEQSCNICESASTNAVALTSLVIAVANDGSSTWTMGPGSSGSGSYGIRAFLSDGSTYTIYPQPPVTLGPGQTTQLGDIVGALDYPSGQPCVRYQMVNQAGVAFGQASETYCFTIFACPASLPCSQTATGELTCDQPGSPNCP